MQPDAMDLLTESIYDAAIEPAGWARVMTMLKDNFSTGAEALYFLDYDRHAVRPVHVWGVEDRFLRTFDACFYAADNPFTRAPALHKPGIVRTDEDVLSYLGDPGSLRKSQYYNEWLQPQDFGHTIGTTLLAEEGVLLNFSLLRSAGVGSFGAREVAEFTRLCRHLQRAFRVAMRLETLASRRSMSFEALEHLRFGVAFLGLRGELLHCNSVAEAVIRAGDGLTLRNGRLAAVEMTMHRNLGALLRRVAHERDPAGRAGTASLTVRRRHARPLTVSAIRVSPGGASFVAAKPAILLMIAEPDAAPPTDFERVRRLYRLAPAESRLAQALLAGGGLKRAAEAAGMTYETARWYLKILFQKTGTNRQAELVALLLGDLSVPWKGRREDA
jgi:DNA-binding CsgD family transcriptional regulator